MKTDNRQSASELISKIREANLAYRNGTPFMSDTEYDNLLDELKNSVEPAVYEAVRESLMEEPGNVPHPYVMGSLDKIKAFDSSASVSKWVMKHVTESSSKDDGIFISSKIDGCSARLSYRNGMLISATTRGDSATGVDITAKAMLFAPTTLKSDFSGEVRGEVTLTNETFEALIEYTGKEYKNLRNSTTGLVNSKDVSEETSFLRFFAYEIMGENHLTKKEQFSKLSKLGFETALYTELTDIYNPQLDLMNSEALDDALLKVYNEFAEKAPFDIDGLVVSDRNNANVFENVKIPTETVAVKFNQMTGNTKLIDVIWNVSKSGRLSPVAIVDMIKLGGSDITNATLNNLDIMKELGLTLGCTVTLLKSGDVIPKIVGVSHPEPENEVPIKYPTQCPSCKSELFYGEDALFPMCTNPKCDGIAHAKILHFLRQLGIKNVSLNRIAEFGLKGIDDIIALRPDGGAVKSRFYDDLGKLMFGASKEKLLMSFDYDGISSKIIEKMLIHYGYDRLLTADYDELSKDFPRGVGKKFLGKFCEKYPKIRDDYFAILNDSRYHGHNAAAPVKKTVVDGPLGGKGFVVTGPLETMSRENFKMAVMQNGGTYQSSVSKKTNYLVCNDTSSATTKVKKAEDLGVMVIDETKFLSMLRDGADGFAIF